MIIFLSNYLHIIFIYFIFYVQSIKRNKNKKLLYFRHVILVVVLNSFIISNQLNFKFIKSIN